MDSKSFSDEIRKLADLVDDKHTDVGSMAFVIGNNEGVKICGYIGNVIPECDIAIAMFKVGIEHMEQMKLNAG